MTPDQVTAWEYETVRPPRKATMEEASDPQELLNEYGREGWEFVNTIEYTGGGTKYLVFKRQAGGDANE